MWNLTDAPTCPNAPTNCTLPNLCSTVCSNDDILGIGIRVNFYATMLLLAFVPRTPYTEELLNVLYANTGIAGLGLLVTAVQQTASKNLSLFHAIYVQHMLFFLGIGVAPVGRYNWTRSRIAIGVFVQFALTIAFTSWAVYLWAHVDDFGSQPYLNEEVKYVLMFVNIKATSPWLRGVWISALVISALVLIITFGINALALFALRHDGEEEEREKEWYFFISIPQMIIAIYSTVMLEVTVQRNSTQHNGVVQVNNSWAFGQTLAVVMIFADVNEVIHYFIGLITRRRQRSREHQAEAETPNDTDIPLVSATYRPKGLPGSHLLAPDSPQTKLSSEHELLNLNKENSHVQVTAVTGVEIAENPQTRDQPVGTLR